MIKILFVCHGNICRSTMCEFVMKELLRQAGKEQEILVESKACRTDEIGNDTHPGTKRALQAHGIPFSKRKAQPYGWVFVLVVERFELSISAKREGRRDEAFFLFYLLICGFVRCHPWPVYATILSKTFKQSKQTMKGACHAKHTGFWVDPLSAGQ